MSKKASNVLGVFTESIGLYFSNFDKFMRYMTFPVLGQVAGLSLIFFITYFYSMNMPKLIDKYPHLNSMGTLILISILITLPGLAIFCKAFWEYLVAYGAVNSMFLNMYKSGKLYDFSIIKYFEIARLTTERTCISISVLTSSKYAFNSSNSALHRAISAIL